ncbi:MAG: TrkA family potassium uptake protein [Bacillota bacterium]|nr:TrkA family potassium uptake protein [Bacillota bacterium]
MTKKNKNGFCIIGLGRFGMALARTLADADADVMVIDNNEDKLKKIRNYVQDAFLIDKLTKEAIEEAGVGECETVIVCIGDKVDVNLLTTLNVIGLGVPRVIAKADSIEHGVILEKIGAEVIHPEMDTATRLAAILLGSRAIDMMRLNDDYVVSEIKISSGFAGRTVKELHVEKYGLKLIALERESDLTITEFTQDYILESDDAIVVLGKFADADRFERMMLRY